MREELDGYNSQVVNFESRGTITALPGAHQLTPDRRTGDVGGGGGLEGAPVEQLDAGHDGGAPRDLVLVPLRSEGVARLAHHLTKRNKGAANQGEF